VLLEPASAVPADADDSGGGEADGGRALECLRVARVAVGLTAVARCGGGGSMFPGLLVISNTESVFLFVCFCSCLPR
jgi:hypothetical protein